MRIAALRTTAVVLAALLVLAGCAGVEAEGDVNSGKTFSNATLEGEISKELEAQSDDKDFTWETTCPKDIRMKQDDDFSCRSTNETGYRVRIAVTQKDAKGNIDFELVDDVEENGAEREGQLPAKP